MNENLDLVAYCGLYCGACSFKLTVDERERAHVLSLPPRYDKAKAEELDPCPGCRNEAAACGSDPCEIRACARARGISHCGECREVPCDLLSAFAGDGAPHHAGVLEDLRRLSEMGSAAWLAEQESLWACACGARRSWYLSECPRCRRAFRDHL